MSKHNVVDFTGREKMGDELIELIAQGLDKDEIQKSGAEPRFSSNLRFDPSFGKTLDSLLADKLSQKIGKWRNI